MNSKTSRRRYEVVRYTLPRDTSRPHRAVPSPPYTPNEAGKKANKKVYLALLVAVEYVACTDEPCLWDLERVGTPLSTGLWLTS